MKILVVDDDRTLRELLAYILANQDERIVALEAGSLDEARNLLPRADAVLCDGSFPTHPGGRTEFVTVCDSNWSCVLMDCQKLKIPFVLLSGNDALVARLCERGTLAFAKPGQAFEAIKSVVRQAALARIHAGTQAGVPVLHIEDPRIQQADIENSRPVEDEQEAARPAPRAWWKRYS